MCRALASVRVRSNPTDSRVELAKTINARKELTGLACVAGVRDERETLVEGNGLAAGDWSGLAARVSGLDDGYVVRTIVSFL